MSDTTEKKRWVHRNWSLLLWGHIKPNTFISHDENYRTSGIYLFVQWRLGNLSLSRFPLKYVGCLWDLDLQRFLWLHFKAHYVLWRGSIISLFFWGPRRITRFLKLEMERFIFPSDESPTRTALPSKAYCQELILSSLEWQRLYVEATPKF